MQASELKCAYITKPHFLKLLAKLDYFSEASIGTIKFIVLTKHHNNKLKPYHHLVDTKSNVSTLNI